MKKCIISVLCVALLFVCALTCQNNKEPEPSFTSKSAVIRIDSIKENYFPVQLEWDERVLASFVVNDSICELLIGFANSNSRTLETKAHRKIILLGINGHWDKKTHKYFFFNNGKELKIALSYPTNRIYLKSQRRF